MTIRRRIEVPEELLVFNEWYLERGIKRVETTQTLAGVVPDGYELVDAYAVGEIVLAPDPDEQKDYDLAQRIIACERERRDLQLLAGVLPAELLTDEEIVADNFCEPPEIVPACSNCGHATFRYDEDTGCYNTMAEATAEVIQFYGGASYAEGTGWPGVICDSCGTMLDTDIEIDFTC